MKKRIITIANRSGKEFCEICRQQAILVTHHINGREIHGWDLPFNRCNICDNCHRKIHSGMINVIGWVMTTDGLVLEWQDNGNR